MKKLLLAIAVLFATQSVVHAADKPTQVNQLPSKAQTFIKKYFPNAAVSYATVDSEVFFTEYKVVFADGCKVEFDKKGELIEVNCKNSSVPAAIVPTAIQSFIAQYHADSKILKLEKGCLGYEVSLNNKLELQFDNKGKFSRYDD